MDIQRNNYSPAFSANFAKTKQFADTVKWAKENNCLRGLDEALYRLSHANPGEITIFHGTTPDGKIFSNFRQGKRSFIAQTSDAQSPAEATYNGIQELSILGRAFRSLMGTSKVSCDVTAEKIMRDYTA